MKQTYYFVNDNGHLRTYLTESENEIARAKVKYGDDLFFNRLECIKAIQAPKETKKPHSLNANEEMEQYIWGLMQMTPEDKALADKERKSIDELQREFAKEYERNN